MAKVENETGQRLGQGWMTDKIEVEEPDQKL
jgi:hypothetical protein